MSVLESDCNGDEDVSISACLFDNDFLSYRFSVAVDRSEAASFIKKSVYLSTFLLVCTSALDKVQNIYANTIFHIIIRFRFVEKVIRLDYIIHRGK